MTLNSRSSLGRTRFQFEQVLRIGIESTVLAMVLAAPWYFGGVGSVVRFGFSIATAFMLLLWGWRLCIVRQWSMQGVGVLICLGLLTLLSALQLVHLPKGLLSSATTGGAETYSYYLPAERELLPDENPGSVVESHPLSISPSDTRDYFYSCVGITVLYAAVVNNIVSQAAFMRLAWLCAINGALLSLLGFAQYISSPRRDLVYFSFPVWGTVFGPFVNRNHFATYASICIGLGMGILAAVARKESRLLQNSRVLWLFSAIGLTATAVAFSYSRGGLLSLMVAVSLGAALWARHGRKRPGSRTLIWLGVTVLVAGGCIGWGSLEARFAKLGADSNASESRFNLWKDALAFAPRFLVFGSGNGTYEVIDPIARSHWATKTRATIMRIMNISRRWSKEAFSV